MNIFQELWNNIESLHKLSSTLQWIAFVLIFLGLVSGITKFFIDQREKHLSNLAQSVKEKVQIERVTEFETTIKSLKSELTSSKDEIAELEKRTVHVNLYKQLIRTASATIEIIINSSENVDANFMDQGGYLAFAKGQIPLMIVSATTCIGKQIGGNKVLYRGVFNLDATSEATQKPVLFLKESEYVQIGFKPIPEKKEVLSGKVIVTINNGVRIEFPIPHQIMTKDFIIVPEIHKYLEDFK